MCGRTALTASPDELRHALGLRERPVLVPHYNVPPSRPVAVVRSSSPDRRIELLRWGLVPPWAESPKIADRLALARAESISDTRAFREAVQKRRCLVIVDGFFEWQRAGRRASQPFFVQRIDQAPFALAGIWERWAARDGEIVESCAIITQAARPPVDAIHDRMPVVLERDAWDRWVDPAPMAPDAIARLLEPQTPALVAYPVGPYVNDPRHDDPRCLAREEPAQLALIP
ncbi:MAG: SOS response-associated peptidase [Myxococcota bacterium]|nr:SOS response-associated peptidase [Myxococcota bacterium]